MTWIMYMYSVHSFLKKSNQSLSSDHSMILTCTICSLRLASTMVCLYLSLLCVGNVR